MTLSKREKIQRLETRLLSLFDDYGLHEYRNNWLQVPEDIVLNLAVAYLDDHYYECPADSGKFYNPLTGAQVRMMDGDLNGHYRGCPSHLNFDTIWKSKGHNYHLELI